MGDVTNYLSQLASRDHLCTWFDFTKQHLGRGRRHSENLVGNFTLIQGQEIIIGRVPHWIRLQVFYMFYMMAVDVRGDKNSPDSVKVPCALIPWQKVRSKLGGGKITHEHTRAHLVSSPVVRGPH